MPVESEYRARFSALLEQHLNAIIQENFAFKELTPVVLREIRNTISQTISDLLSKSRYSLSPPALSWLSDQYFKAVKVNDDLYVENMIYAHEYELSELDFSDITLLESLFSNTKMGTSLKTELTNRLSKEAS